MRNRIYKSLEEEMKNLDKRPNYMTVPAVIKELGKIEMVRQLDNIYRLDHALTATQKTILRAFNMDAAYVKHQVAKISEALKNTGNQE